MEPHFPQGWTVTVLLDTSHLELGMPVAVRLADERLVVRYFVEKFWNRIHLVQATPLKEKRRLIVTSSSRVIGVVMDLRPALPSFCGLRVHPADVARAVMEEVEECDTKISNDSRRRKRSSSR